MFGLGKFGHLSNFFLSSMLLIVRPSGRIIKHETPGKLVEQ